MRAIKMRKENGHTEWLETMVSKEAKESIALLLQQGAALVDIAKTALKGNKPLGGSNFYGNKFHDSLVELARTESQVDHVLKACQLTSDQMAQFSGHMTAIKATSSAITAKQRETALRQLRLLCEAVIMPAIERITTEVVPQTEQVLPLSVVQNTRSYIEKVILQANGCYERRWFDGSSVMLRKFVEIFIIEVYEAKGRAAEVKDNNGDFLMLNGLIDTILKDTTLNLARETKRTLPLVKQLGDRSAHNRRYLATQQDINQVVPGLRVVADDLLHLAGLK